VIRPATPALNENADAVGCDRAGAPNEVVTVAGNALASAAAAKKETRRIIRP
jgi:hypothetical protein